jgi:conjugal transfer pilus assembly protein TraF
VAQLNHPELDYNLEHPHYNSTVPLQQAKDQSQQAQAIAALSESTASFTSIADGPIDAQMAGVVADFARARGYLAYPVSVTARILPSCGQQARQRAEPGDGH